MRPRLEQILRLTAAYFALALLVLSSANTEAEEAEREVYEPYGGTIPEIMDLRYLERLGKQVADFICKTIEMPPLTGWDCGVWLDTNELTFAPEAWKVPSVLLMMRGVEWQINEADDTAKDDEYCTALFDDLYAWRGLRVVEPSEQTNEFGHVKFARFHRAIEEGMGTPHRKRFSWGADGGVKAFRWYRYPANDGRDINLLTFQDYAHDIDEMGNRTNGPLKSPISRGSDGRLIDLEKPRASPAGIMKSVAGSFSFYPRKVYEVYSAGEFLVVTREEPKSNLIISIEVLFDPNGSEHSDNNPNGRFLNVHSGGRYARWPFFDLGENPLQCSFRAPPGNVELLRDEPVNLKLQ